MNNINPQRGRPTPRTDLLLPNIREPWRQFALRCKELSASIEQELAEAHEINQQHVERMDDMLDAIKWAHKVLIVIREGYEPDVPSAVKNIITKLKRFIP